MRNHSLTGSRTLQAGLKLLTVASFFAMLTPAIHAQSTCADGSDPDTLGCQSQVASPSSSTGSIATLTVQERSPDGTPSADRSTEASANSSLTNGASFSEAPTSTGRRFQQARPFANDAPTEFQNFVFATTGQMLPIYGARLFTSQPASFASLDHGPAPGDLITGPGDELRIRIWGQVNFSANLRVSREGEIYLPKVGAVHIAGLPFSAVREHLKTAMESVYRNFELTVDLGEIHTIQIYVTGMARQPGEFTVSALSTLVDAIFVAGGPSATGSMRHVQVKRAGVVITDFDLYSMLVNGDKSGDIQLQPGDVLNFPAAGPEVALLGSVRQTGIYELRGKESIGELLNFAGGRTEVADHAQLTVDRIEDHARRRAFEVAGNPSGLTTLLVAGDILHVDPIISIYRDTVTLRGAVANPGHFLWHEGMRLSELMPERDALLKRDYWWQRSRLGLPVPQETLSTGSDSQSDKPPALQSPGGKTNWNQAVIERLDPSTMTTGLIPFKLGRLVLDHDRSEDIELNPGDVVTIYAQQDVLPPIAERTVYVQLQGEFVHPGIYSASPNETLRSLVKRAGGLTDRAYLYGSVFTRASTQALEQQQMNEYTNRLERQLELNSVEQVRTAAISEQQTTATDGNQAASLNRAIVARLRQTRASGRVVLSIDPLSKDAVALPDMHLEDGDCLTVPFAPETIQVIGSVFNPHAFLYDNDARAGEYLRMAGGPNRGADRKKMFVLRADGSVVGRGIGSPVFKSEFNKLRLYPGDAIVVPEKDTHPSMFSQIMGWSQLMSQMSLSSLVVDSLK